MSAKKLFLLLILSLVALMTLTLASCGGGGSGSSNTGDGTLKLYLTDSATQDYRAIYVTIDRVEVKRVDETWEVAATPQATYNLLELVNGEIVELGGERLSSGNYSQMRLIIGNTHDGGQNIAGDTHEHANYLLIGDDLVVEPFKKIPSGPQTGIKIVGGFTINTDQTTELLLDFDVMRSVVKLGNGEYLLKPTIKVLHIADVTSVAGTVTTTADEVLTPLSGAFVSAQAGETLQIQAGTVSDEQGRYKLFLMPDSYTLVATADGYLPACDSRTLISGDNKEDINFDLTAAVTTFELSGTVTVAEPGENQSVTLTFYQTIACNDATPATVVVRELNVAAEVGGVSYHVSLPAGDYGIVATTEVDDETELTTEMDINLNDDTENFDFNF